MTTTDIQPPWDNGAHRQGERFGGPYSRHDSRHDARNDDRAYGRPPVLRRAEAWLDDRGKGAWIALMVLAFVFVWPVGLALLAYMIWSKRMFGQSCNRGHGRDDARWSHHQARRDQFHAARAAMRPSGNSAFDSYKTDTLRRLEDEQRAFEDFLSRLRNAKDKAEFDEFMADRARRPATPGDDSMPEPSAK